MRATLNGGGGSTDPSRAEEREGRALGSKAERLNVLLAHEGELADVRALLEEMGVDYLERSGSPSRPGDPVWDLMVATPKRGLQLRAGTTRMVIVSNETRTLLSMLKRAGIELMVRRPVHPAALRLLLLHALYRGPEKRRRERVSVGAQIRFKTGLRKKSAILADLSLRGCRLLSSHSARRDQSISVLLPPDVVGGKGMRLRGKVVRTGPASGEHAGTQAIAISFTSLDRGGVARLQKTVAAYSGGPAVLRDAKSETSCAAPAESLPELPCEASATTNAEGAASGENAAPPTPVPESPSPGPASEESTRPAEAVAEKKARAQSSPSALEAPEPEPSPRVQNGTPEGNGSVPGSAPAADGNESAPGSAPIAAGNESAPSPTPGTERRGTRRYDFERSVIALGEQATRVLIGRDISTGGMRVDSTESLQVGDRLRVALHVRARSEPLVVEATVERDDGDAGFGLRFCDLSDSSRDYLNKMVHLLPILAARAQGDDPEGAVISEILERTSASGETQTHEA